MRASGLQLAGAFGFGAVIGWFTYFVNRYRSGDVRLADVASVVGALGGGAVLALFPARSDLFGAYGVGLATGFFAYLVVLLVLVARSPAFTIEWFLDGRRRAPADGFEYPRGAIDRPLDGGKGGVVRR